MSLYMSTFRLGLERVLLLQRSLRGSIEGLAQTEWCRGSWCAQARQFLGSSASSSKKESEESGARKRKPYNPDAWKSRIPKGQGRLGVKLKEQDPERFEQMRLLLGFYDMPENSHLPKPPPPKSVTISNLQTMWFTDEVDPYYKLSLLSYRAKELNKSVMSINNKSAWLLHKLATQQADFVPAIPTRAAASSSKHASASESNTTQGATSGTNKEPAQ
eukprot:jgi/Chrzof1/14151/Cz08g27020.t1